MHSFFHKAISAFDDGIGLDSVVHLLLDRARGCLEGRTPKDGDKRDIEMWKSQAWALTEKSTFYRVDQEILGEIFNFLGKAEYLTGNLEQARPWLEKCLSIRTKTLGEMDIALAENYENLGVVYTFTPSRSIEMLEDGLNYLKKTKEIKIENNLDLDRIVNLETAIAFNYLFQNKLEEASEQFSRFTYENPLDESRFRLLGIIEMLAGHYQKSADALIHSSLLRKETPDEWACLIFLFAGSHLKNQGDEVQAAKYLQYADAFLGRGCEGIRPFVYLALNDLPRYLSCIAVLNKEMSFMERISLGLFRLIS